LKKADHEKWPVEYDEYDMKQWYYIDHDEDDIFVKGD
jgi:hypothetical protein